MGPLLPELDKGWAAACAFPCICIPRGPALDILVVEDDADLRHLVGRFLEKQGFGVVLAEHPLEALEQLSTRKVDLIVTDYMMPHMDGVAFTEQIKANPALKEIPVILITAWPDDGVTERGMRKGVALSLPKPIDFNRLLTLIRFAE